MARILVVGDDRLIRQVVWDLLEVADPAVAEAVEGAAGLAAGNGSPDVSFLDVLMPTMTGLEVCQQVRADPA